MSPDETEPPPSTLWRGTVTLIASAAVYLKICTWSARTPYSDATTTSDRPAYTRSSTDASGQKMSIVSHDAPAFALFTPVATSAMVARAGDLGIQLHQLKMHVENLVELSYIDLHRMPDTPPENGANRDDTGREGVGKVSASLQTTRDIESAACRARSRSQ